MTTNGTHVVRKSVNIHASPEKVWKALTDPEITRKYFYGCRVESPWKVGSDISWKRKMLWIPFELKGKIIDLKEPNLLQYTVDHRDKKGSSEVKLSLVDEGGKTTVHCMDDVGETPGMEKRYKRSLKGWKKILKGLKKTVEELG
jgi:uncharacterized protein YndB with AHSA1/START domain